MVIYLQSIKSFFDNQDKFLDQEINLGGWVRTLRNSKNISFIELHDGSCFKTVQIVIENNLENYLEVSKLCVGSSVLITGLVTKSPGNKQDLEIIAKKIIIQNAAPENYPLQKKRHSLEYLRTLAHLRARTNSFYCVFKIRSLVSFAIHKFFQERNFIYIHTPIITTSDCEGAGEMFKINNPDLKSKEFFGKPAFLTVSGQLAAEAFALSMRSVYTFGPTFRAENSNTARHAAEFWMIEPEIAFCDLNNCMQLAEEMLKFCVKYILDNAPDEINFCNKFIDNNLSARLENIIKYNFECLSYSEAVELLKSSKEKFEYKITWGSDLQTEHERYLTEKIFKKPVFIINYPKEIKAFYMKQNQDKKTVAAMDLLVPNIGEIIGGSQREENLEVLIARLKELNLNLDNYWWYLELRKFGSVVHSGYGLGFERLIMYLTGMNNIRDVIPFPRTVNNAEF